MNVLNFKNINDDDAKEVCSWLSNNQEFFYWAGSDFKPNTCIEKIVYLNQSINNIQMIGFTDTKEPISYCELHLLDYKSKWRRIVRLVVNPKYRHLGYGTQTVSFFTQKAREIKTNRLDLIVFPENKDAFKFYLKQGFTIDESLKNTKIHNNDLHDILILSKDLGEN